MAWEYTEAVPFKWVGDLGVIIVSQKFLELKMVIFLKYFVNL
jgi:hypothetical protein